MRIQKYMSEKGILSRRKTEEYILLGKISVNGVVVKELGTQIDPEKDKVEIVGEKKESEKKSTFAVYKPKGVSISEDSGEGKTLGNSFPKLSHLTPTDTLDKESEGLLVLTNNAIVQKKLSLESTENEFEITAKEDIVPAIISNLEKNLRSSNGKAERIDKHTITIAIKGSAKKVKSLCEGAHITILTLKRIRISNISIGALGPGNARALTPEELSNL